MAITIDAATLVNGGLIEQLNNAIMEAVAKIFRISILRQLSLRKVQLTLTIKPSASRREGEVEISCKTTLQPREAVTTTIAMGTDMTTGKVVCEEICAGENSGQCIIPGSGAFESGELAGTNKDRNWM